MAIYGDNAFGIILGCGKGGALVKSLLKQKMLWVAVACVLVAACIAIIDGVVYSRITLVKKYETSVNSRNVKKMISCFEPDLQEELKDEISVDDLKDEVLEGKIRILPVDSSVEDEDGTREIKTIVIYNVDGTCQDIACVKMYITNINGKDYFASTSMY